jgi:deoxyribonuclease-4
MKKESSLLFGAHMSISDGFDQAVLQGEAIGCTAIQIFTKSNRQWACKPLEKKRIDALKKALQSSCVKTVIAHATYLINIGSPDVELAKKSTNALITELNRCSELGIKYLVLHPGSHSNADITECLTRISAHLDHALESSTGTTSILLETMAGQGTSIGHTFEQLALIIKKSHHKKRIGICFDTCHAFAAGYDFRDKKSYKKMWDHFDEVIGLNKLHAIHVNDSKTDLGSHVDRHTHIGQGKIGLLAFKMIFKDPRFVAIPKILETPHATNQDHKRNIDTIKSLIS